MITYDNISYQLDETASGLSLILPLPTEADPRPMVLGQLRLVTDGELPDRGDFIGQDIMLLQTFAMSVDMEQWQDLHGFKGGPPEDRFKAMTRQLLIRPEAPPGTDRLVMNISIGFSCTFRSAGGYNFIMELEGVFLPKHLASQRMFGWGSDKPSDEELEKTCEYLNLIEELPLWNVLVWVPEEIAAPTSWARQQAQERCGFTDLRIEPTDQHRMISTPKEPSSAPQPVSFITPWAN